MFLMTGIPKLLITSANVLMLTAAALTTEAQAYSWDHLPVVARPAFKKDSFSIVSYGAVADGVTLNTTAINRAIEG